jgi:hypothetical protein
LFLGARQAAAVHVPSGPSSGLEHVFTMAFGVILMAMAVLSAIAGVLSIVAGGTRDAA